MSCGSCGAATPDGARFCPSCGATVSTRADERRVATVLFGDVVGFTGLSEARDPETVKNLVEVCFDRLAADIVAFGGRVDKIVGDGIVALFGAPVAHEDDAERAVRAALQMQATLAEHRTRAAVDIHMRIGVNTGEVLVGALRAGDDYTAMGDVVNTASRLQTAAGPGEVLVGPATYEATAGVIRYEPVGAVDVRGREQPVRTWRALEAVARPGRRPRRSRTPLVGRDAELTMLRSALESAVVHRRAQLVLVAGDAGVGKSRLASELAGLAAAEHGAFLLEGHCVPYGEANVWWPVAEALQQACAIEPSDTHDDAAAKCRKAVSLAIGQAPDSDEVDDIAAGLLYLIGDERALAGVDPARAREQAVYALSTALGGLASTRPVVVVLSDIHWADTRVLELLERLIERMAHQPLVLLATTRPDLVTRWRPPAGSHNLVHLHLDPLPAQDAAALLDELLGDDTPPDVRDALLERSGGNPFFLEELVALVAGGDGATAAASGEARRPVSALATLPATLRGLVAARIDQLSPAERAALEDAAVIGRTGPLESLAELASARAGRGDAGGNGSSADGSAPHGADGDPVVRRLVDHDLLVVMGGEYEFKTDLVREVAYSILTKGERARRHALLAERLECRAREAGREDEYLEQLAHHWGSAAELVNELGGVEGVPEEVCTRALDSLRRAAARAEANDEPLVTARLYDQMLRILPTEERPARWEALLGRAKARAAVHALRAARDDVVAVRQEAAAAGDELTLASACTVFGDVLTKEGELQEAAEVLGEAVSRWKELGDPRGFATALRLQGFNDLMRNDLAAADAAIREALTVFRSLSDRRGEAWALQHLAWIAFQQGQSAVADERLTRAAAAFHEVGDRGGEGWAKGLMAWVRFQQGRLDEAERLALKVLPRAIDRGERWAVAILTVLLAQIELWRGHAGSAVSRGREALQMFEEIDDRYGQVQALTALVRALAASGDVPGAIDAIDRIRSRTGPDGPMGPLAEALRGGLAVYLGDVATLTALAEKLAPAASDKVTNQVVVSERAVALGLGLLQLGRVGEALNVLGAIEPGPDDEGLAANLAGARALALAAAGRPDEAIAAAEAVDGTERGTYLDRLTAGIARGLAEAQERRITESATTFRRVTALADASEDVVVQALARLAAAHGSLVTGGDGAGALDDARRRLAAVGIDAAGWNTAYRLAAAGVPGSVEGVAR